MPRVPQYPIGSVQPPSGAPVFIDNGPGETIARAGYGLAGAIGDVALKQQEEQRRIKDEAARLEEERHKREQQLNMQRAQNELARYQFDSETAAEADPNNQGYSAKGHYERMTKANNDFIATLPEKYNIDPEYSDLAVAKFQEYSNSFYNNAAHWEASNMQSARMQTFGDAVDIANTRATNDVKYGGWDVIESSVKDIENAGTTLGATPDKVKAITSNSVSMAFLAWSDDNPVAALDALDDSRAEQYMPAEMRMNLRDSIEKKTIPYLVNASLTDITQVPGYENQVALANKIEDDKVRAGVLGGLKDLEDERKAALKQNQESVRDKFLTYIDEGKPLGTRSAFVKTLEDALPGDENAQARHTILGHWDAEKSRRESEYKKANKVDEIPGLKEYKKESDLSAIRRQVYMSNITDPDMALDMARSGLIPPEYVTDARQIIQENAKKPEISQYVTRANRMYKMTPTQQAMLGDTLTVAYQDSKKSGKPFDFAEMQGIADLLIKTPQFLKGNPDYTSAPLAVWATAIRQKYPDATLYHDTSVGETYVLYTKSDGHKYAEDAAGNVWPIPDSPYPMAKTQKAH